VSEVTDHTEFERAAFNAVASTYDLWADTATPFRSKMLERVGIGPGQSLLDVACASGQLVVEAANIVGPAGRVVGIDIADNMVQVARRKAAKMHLINVEFRRMNAEELDFADGGFDAATAGLCLFHFSDPARALAEIRRVLKPGGAFAASVWTAGSYHALPYAYARELSRGTGPRRSPGDQLDSRRLATFLAQNGFVTTGQEEVISVFEFADTDEYLKQMMGFPGRSMAYFRTLSVEIQEEALIRTFDRLERDFLDGDVYRVPLKNVVGWGRKP
jgi:ubiquinone/menaquinone biosynthesis C-methylase UbiE